LLSRLIFEVTFWVLINHSCYLRNIVYHQTRLFVLMFLSLNYLSAFFAKNTLKLIQAYHLLIIFARMCLNTMFFRHLATYRDFCILRSQMWMFFIFLIIQIILFCEYFKKCNISLSIDNQYLLPQKYIWNRILCTHIKYCIQCL